MEAQQQEQAKKTQLGGSRMVVAGHVAIDRIIDFPNQEIPRLALGGGVTYSALTLSSLGYGSSIVTKVGLDFEPGWIEYVKKHSGVDLSNFQVKDQKTTSFRIDRAFEPRKLWLLARCSSLEITDFKKNIAENNRETLVLNPIAGEISLSLLDRVSKEFDFVLVDSQGFVRRISPKTSEVSLRQGLDISSLSGVDLLKADRQELCAWTGNKDVESSIRQISKFVEYILVPSGGESVLLYKDGKPKCSADPHIVEALDTTGAGDILLSVLAAKYAETKDIDEALVTSVSAASLSVRKFGIEKAILDKSEVERRAKTVQFSQKKKS